MTRPYTSQKCETASWPGPYLLSYLLTLCIHRNAADAVYLAGLPSGRHRRHLLRHAFRLSTSPTSVVSRSSSVVPQCRMTSPWRHCSRGNSSRGTTTITVVVVVVVVVIIIIKLNDSLSPLSARSRLRRRRQRHVSIRYICINYLLCQF